MQQHVEVEVDPPRLRARKGDRAVEEEAGESVAEDPIEPGAQRIGDRNHVVGERREFAGRDRRHESRSYDGRRAGQSPSGGYSHLR